MLQCAESADGENVHRQGCSFQMREMCLSAKVCKQRDRGVVQGKTMMTNNTTNS